MSQSDVALRPVCLPWTTWHTRKLVADARELGFENVVGRSKVARILKAQNIPSTEKF